MPERSQNPGHSFSIAQHVACPSCRREFEADLWLIVDAAQRRDLVERIRAGQLHELMCPHCGEAGHVDAPLLVYRPDTEPPLLFSPASQTSGEQAQEHTVQLVGTLQQSLGEAWRDDWLAQGLHGVSRDALPALLSDAPEATMCGLQDEESAQMPPELRAVLQELAAEGIEIRSPEDLLRVLAERPNLQARLDAAIEAWVGISVPAVFQVDFERATEGEQRYLLTGDQAALDAAADAWRRILDDPAFVASNDQVQLTMWTDAGDVIGASVESKIWIAPSKSGSTRSRAQRRTRPSCPSSSTTSASACIPATPGRVEWRT